MGKIILFTIVGILIYNIEAVFLLNNLFNIGYTLNREIIFYTIIFFSVLSCYIAVKYLSLNKLVIFSLVLSISFSIFHVIWFSVFEVGWFEINYILTFGMLLYLFFVVLTAFIFNICIIGSILLLKKAYSYVKTKI